MTGARLWVAGRHLWGAVAVGLLNIVVLSLTWGQSVQLGGPSDRSLRLWEVVLVVAAIAIVCMFSPRMPSWETAGASRLRIWAVLPCLIVGLACMMLPVAGLRVAQWWPSQIRDATSQVQGVPVSAVIYPGVLTQVTCAGLVASGAALTIVGIAKPFWGALGAGLACAFIIAGQVIGAPTWVPWPVVSLSTAPSGASVVLSALCWVIGSVVWVFRTGRAPLKVSI